MDLNTTIREIPIPFIPPKNTGVHPGEYNLCEFICYKGYYFVFFNKNTRVQYNLV